MAYGGRGDDEMISSLGSSYLDGIPVTISPRFQMPVDLSAVQALLNTPGPSLDAIDQWKVRCSVNTYSRLNGEKSTHSFLQCDCNLERQVLEQLRLMDEENERKAREDEEAREEYRARKEREKIERDERKRIEEERLKKEKEEREEEKRREQIEEREEEERRAQEEGHNEGGAENGEEVKNEPTRESREADSSPEDEPVAKPASAPPPRPPPPQLQADNLSGGLQALQLSNGTATAASPAPPVPGGAKINFSEFEAESDPFDSMELKTINELQELAAVLQTTTTAAPQSGVTPAVSTATAGAGPSSNIQHHPQFHQQPCPPSQQVRYFLAITRGIQFTRISFLF